MSTSFLYHTLGIYGYNYVHQKFENGNYILKISPKYNLMVCPNCNSKDIIRRGVTIRRLRTIPIGEKPVILLVEIPRIQCTKCNCIRQINIGIADPKKTYTRRLARYIITLSKMTTLTDISKLLGIGWDCIKEIVKSNLEKRYTNPSLKNLTHIAIDEISIRKSHKYLTIVMDLKSGKVVFVGDGKGSEALEPFWERLKHSGAKLEAVSTDLSPAYISSVITHLSGKCLVFDHFHIVKLMNDALADIRRGLYNELNNTMGKRVLKGTRWILLKNPENLSSEHNEAEKLQEALRLNAPLATAYYMKEDLRQFWNQQDKGTASIIIDSWINRALTSGIRALQKVARTIAAHKSGILNWYDHPITSGKIEGTNNKIKVLKRIAYGYRDKEFFKFRIMAIHETKYGLTG